MFIHSWIGSSTYGRDRFRSTVYSLRLLLHQHPPPLPLHQSHLWLHRIAGRLLWLVGVLVVLTGLDVSSSLPTRKKTSNLFDNVLTMIYKCTQMIGYCVYMINRLYLVENCSLWFFSCSSVWTTRSWFD